MRTSKLNCVFDDFELSGAIKRCPNSELPWADRRESTRRPKTSHRFHPYSVDVTIRRDDRLIQKRTFECEAGSSLSAQLFIVEHEDSPPATELTDQHYYVQIIEMHEGHLPRLWYVPVPSSILRGLDKDRTTMRSKLIVVPDKGDPYIPYQCRVDRSRSQREITGFVLQIAHDYRTPKANERDFLWFTVESVPVVAPLLLGNYVLASKQFTHDTEDIEDENYDDESQLLDIEESSCPESRGYIPVLTQEFFDSDDESLPPWTPPRSPSDKT